MMKIMHVGSNSIHVTGFINALSVQAVEQSLLSDAEIKNDQLLMAEVVHFHTFNPIIIAVNLKKVKRFLKDVQPDVLHIHQITRLAFWVSFVAKSLKIPIVTTAWGSDVLLMPQKNWLNRFLVTKTIQRSKIVTADAQAMIDVMKKLVNEKVVYKQMQYGIDSVPANASKEAIIYSNRLHKPLYRIDRIIEYFSEVHAQFPSFKLVIGATGDETPKLKKLVKDLKIEESVEFVGWLTNEQNREWYAKSTYYISIPESDGTSVSLLEAISAQCIPIVSDLPANKEWVTDGQNGIVEKNGTNPMKVALESDFTHSLVDNAQRVNRLASRSFTIPQFYSYYEQCIAK